MCKDQKQADSTTKYKKTMANKWETLMEPIRERMMGERKQKPLVQRDFFRYEHPDLEREGIVFIGNR